MNKTFRNFLIISVLLTTGNIYCQEALSLEDAVRIALKNNYSITMLREGQKIFENNASIGNAGFLPTLNGSGSYNKETSTDETQTFGGVNSKITNGKYNTLSAGVALSWTIFDGLKMFVSLDRLKQLRDMNRTDFKSKVEGLVFDVNNLYYTLVREKRVLNVMNKNLALSKERMDIVQAEKDLGSASKFDLLQANVDYNEDKSNYLHEEQKISQLYNNFLAMLNVENKNFTFSDSIPAPLKLEYTDIEKLALENNTDLIMASQRNNIAHLDVSIAKSDWFPEISLGAGYNFLKTDNSAGSYIWTKSYGWNYGVNLRLNLFNGLNTLRQVENASVNQDIAELDIKNVKQKVYTDLNNSYKRYTSGLELVQLEKDNLSAASQNSDIAIERLRLGEISALEFRNIQRNLLDAESRLYAALLDLKLSEIDLLRISGKLITVE